jgi:hypothetical protein
MTIQRTSISQPASFHDSPEAGQLRAEPQDQTPIQRVAGQEERLAPPATAEQLSYDELYELMYAAVDTDGLLKKFREGDPTTIQHLSENEVLFAHLKDRLGRINALRDAVMALQDDEIARRKKLADSLSRIA